MREKNRFADYAIIFLSFLLFFDYLLAFWFFQLPFNPFYPQFKYFPAFLMGKFPKSLAIIIFNFRQKFEIIHPISFLLFFNYFLIIPNQLHKNSIKNWIELMNFFRLNLLQSFQIFFDFPHSFWMPQIYLSIIFLWF